MQRTTLPLRNFLLFILLFSFQLCFSSGLDISVDTVSKALVAPEGQYYQWYHNDAKIIGANDQSLQVTESGHYSVEVIDSQGQLSKTEVAVAVTATGAIVKIYIIGDSTICNYAASAYPQTGWGQLLGNFFTTGSVTIENKAIGGRSSRSFFEEGRWTSVKDALKAGDYVFIQFGHNDRDYSKAERYTPVADYKTYLTTYCNDAKAKGAIPVLVSPMVMNAWTGTTMRNVFTESGNDYRGGMLQVATALNVAFIDLNMKSWNLYKTYGSAYNQRFLYKGFVAGEYPNYPDGITDGTHFQEMGSLSHCRMISEGLKELSSRADMANLISILKPLYSIGVSVNPTGSDDMTTKTGTYPQGVTVTLKTIPKSGSTFQKWNNATGSSIATKTLTTLTSGGSATSYSAIYQGASITDCNNTANGTAKVDNCERCVGGTTGKTACSSVAEAETEACSYTGTTEATNGGFKGTSYLNTNNEIGASIRFYLQATIAGAATISFRYACSADRPAQIVLNGATLPNTVTFSSTTDFTTWKTVDVGLTLVKGSNELVLSPTTASGLANIDQIGYVSAGLSKGTCLTTAIEDLEVTDNIVVYPNPFSSNFHIQSKGDFDYTIIDVTGKTMEQCSSGGGALAGNHLPSGLYMIQLRTAQTSKTIPVLKK